LTNHQRYAIIITEKGGTPHRKRENKMANNINITINFDMDGTIADLYGEENWLNDLINERTTPYANAKPLLRLATLARMLNTLKKNGYNLAVISWLSKSGTEEYNERVTAVKMAWLEKHLPSVKWDRITIIPYGTPKENYCENPLDILFDDEEKNRVNWTGRAFNVENIIDTLKTL